MDSVKEFQNNRILIIDDNPDIHQNFFDILDVRRTNPKLDLLKADIFGDSPVSTSQSHFQVETALQGVEGYEKVKSSKEAGAPFAMAFVDMRMPPGWDGIETISRLWDCDPDLEIVICTAYSDYSWEKIMDRIGGSCEKVLFLKKPFDSIEVRQLAHALTQKWQLRKKAHAQNVVLQKIVEKRTEHLVKEKQAHAESEDKLRAILNATTDLAILVGNDGCIMDINENASCILGQGNTSLLGSRLEKILPSDCAASMTEHLAIVQKTGKPVHFEKKSFGKLFDTRIFPVCSTKGQVTATAVFCRDITRQKEMEVQLMHAQKLESIGELAAGIAHEINTPIQYIGDNVHFLEDAFNDIEQLLNAYHRLVEDLPQSALANAARSKIAAAEDEADYGFIKESAPGAFVAAREGVQRVSEIVRAMKAFAHPDERTKTPADLNHALTTTLTITRNEYKYFADVETQFSELPMVMCFAGDLSQVFLNLIVNAAHAIEDAVNGTQTKGTIRISSKQEEDNVVISISDTGNGIPVDIRDRVFDPFFTTKEVGKGSGQGLAIARSIVVDKHSGHIDFDTELNQGTTFNIYLPIDGEPDSTDQNI